MIRSNRMLFDCFSTGLLIYTYKFLRLYANTGFYKFSFVSISFIWFSKISYLVRNGLYDYASYRKIYFLRKKDNLKMFSILRLKIIEISFCFLIISFISCFPSERLNEWV